jgi:flagellar hook protein FlgE
MFTSFSTALSALNATSTAIDVVGNNLANLNTPGFKASVVSFHDLVTQSLGAGLGETQVGFGVGRPITLREFTQGAQQTTNGPLDVMIQGDGFFVVSGIGGATEYTRGGNMQVDQNGNLTTATGEQVQGWTTTNGVLDTNAPIGDIQVPVGGVKAPIPTKSFSFDINLNASATAGPPPDRFSESINIYDSLGEAHTVTVTFTKNANAGQWDYSLSMDANDVTTPVAPTTNTITFGSDGTMTSPLAADPAPAITIPDATFKDGAAGMTINWNLYRGTTPRLTQYAQPSSLSAQQQDGSPAAQLVRVAIANGGSILAQYSDGGQTVVGQLAMATIRNPESLIAVGDNNYQASGKTALPAIGIPGTGGRGTVIGGSVESSTTDIAQEFTNLIVYQRAYQANARVVTTVDQLSQETINLKQA